MSATRANSIRTPDAEDIELPFERGGEFDEETFEEVFTRAVECVRRTGVDHLIMGGLASNHYGRPRYTHDLDLFVRPDDAERVLESFETGGFSTQKTYPDWLFKAVDKGVLVDLIFKAKGHVYLDDEMLERAEQVELFSVPVRIIPPEDLIVIKAIVHDEHMPRHWYDCLGILGATELDWEYLLRRARLGAKRVLSLLIYAQSNDLIVPDSVIASLWGELYESV